MALTDLTRISTSGIATGTSLSGAILHGDAHFRGTQVGVTSALFDSSDNALEFNDNVKLKLGNSGNFSLYSDGVNGILHSQNDPLYLKGEAVFIQTNNNEPSAYFFKNGAVKLYFDGGDPKFETTSTGAVVTGILTATSFSGPIVGNTNNTSGLSTFYDLKVSNNLTVEGTTTTLDTNLIGVDRVEVGANSNTVTGIAVTQSGTADIVRLYDGTSQVVTVDDTGNVGLGSAIPAKKLDVNGTAQFQDDINIKSGNPIILANAANSASTQILCDGGARLHLKSYNQTVATFEEGVATTFYQSSGTNRLQITPTGSIIVGAGTTIKIPDKIMHYGDEDTFLEFGDNTISFETAGSNRLHIASNGRIGIGGSTVPNAPLDVFKVNGTIAVFGDSRSSTHEAIKIKNNVASYPAITNDSTHDTLDLRSMGSVQATIDSNNNDTGNYFRVMANGEGGNGTEIFRAQENGRVGIGTATVHRILHINDTLGGGIGVNGTTSGIQFGLVSMAGGSYNAILSRAGSNDDHITGSTPGDLCLAPEKEGAFILGLSPHLGAMTTGLRIDRLRNYDIYFNSQIKINTGSPASPTERVRITSNGGVGIGTDSITSGTRLHVFDGIVNVSSASTDTRIQFQRKNTGSVGWVGIPYWDPDGFYIYGPTSNSNEIGAKYSQSTWRFYTGGDERLRIDSSGKLSNTYDGTPYDASYGQFEIAKNGVGGTDPDWSYLSLHRVGQVAWQQGILNNNFVIASTGGAVKDTLDSEKLIIDTDGRVMIGNEHANNMFNGADDLVVGNTTGAHGITIITQNNSVGRLLFSDSTSQGAATYQGQINYNHSNDRLDLRTYTLGQITLSTSNTERLYVRSDGSVRIHGGDDNCIHSISNNWHGNQDFSHRGNRVLTSNATGWRTSVDGADPILVLISSADTNRDPERGQNYGLLLHTESQVDNAYAPMIGFSNRSNSGNYNTTFAAILGKKTGQATDSNWSSGQLEFYTNKPSGTQSGYMNDVPDMTISEKGYVNQPRQPAFHANGQAASPHDSAAGANINLSEYMIDVITNIGDHYKNSGTDQGKFVAPIAGNYFFYGQCLLRQVGNGIGSGELTFYKNGSNVAARALGYTFVTEAAGGNTPDNYGTDHDSLKISCILTLAVGDKVHLQSLSTASGVDWYWGSGLGHFGGYLIG